MENIDQVITLQQLENISFIKHDRKPASLYAIAFWCFSKRARAALKSAEAGQFSELDKLIVETKELLVNFVDRVVYLQQQKDILSDPTGPEARRLEEIKSIAYANYRNSIKGKRP
jgi:hypothetical protein